MNDERMSVDGRFGYTPIEEAAGAYLGVATSFDLETMRQGKLTIGSVGDDSAIAAAHRRDAGSSDLMHQVATIRVAGADGTVLYLTWNEAAALARCLQHVADVAAFG